jgi:predicted glycosyl hydrolase (DUF1957 family)
VRQVDMLAVSREDGRCLKRLFSLHVNVRKTLEIVDKLSFRTPPQRPRLRLLREMAEPEGLQLRARWDLDHEDWAELEEKILAPSGLHWADVDVHIELLDVTGESFTVRPDESPVITTSESWCFSGLEPGHAYCAELLLRRRDTGQQVGPAFQRSERAVLPRQDAFVTLLPVSSRALLAVWGGEVAASVAMTRGKDVEVRLAIDLHRVEGGCIVEAVDHREDVVAGQASALRLPAAPGTTYRARLMASVRGKGPKELTIWSGEVTTPHEVPGTAPIRHRTTNRIPDHPTVRPLVSPRDTARHARGRLLLLIQAHTPFVVPRTTLVDGGLPAPLSYPSGGALDLCIDSLVPLLSLLEDLGREEVDLKLSMALSSSFIGTLRCPLHQEQLLRRVERRLALGWLDTDRCRRHEPHLLATAEAQLARLQRTHDHLLSCRLDLTVPLRRQQDAGRLEVLLAPATAPDVYFSDARLEILRAQIEAAAAEHVQVFGRESHGAWLTHGYLAKEAGRMLSDIGVRFALCPSSALLAADAPLERGKRAPYLLSESDVVAIPLDERLRDEILPLAGEGVPESASYLDPESFGRALRYHRTSTPGLEQRDLYDQERGREEAAREADRVLEVVGHALEQGCRESWGAPVVAVGIPLRSAGSPWFEGIDFLDILFRKLHFDQSSIEVTTGSDLLGESATLQEISLRGSCGDDQGRASVLRPQLGPLVRHLHRATEEMVRLTAEAFRHHDLSALESRVLAQAARQLLLAQEGELARAIATSDHAAKARASFLQILTGFWALSSMAWGLGEGHPADESLLAEIEVRHGFLPQIDPELYAPRSAGPARDGESES